MNEKHKEYICTCIIAAIGIPLVAISAKVAITVTIMGESIETVRQWVPVICGLFLLLCLLRIWIASDEEEEESYPDSIISEHEEEKEE